jgi:hypothetical protein
VSGLIKRLLEFEAGLANEEARLMEEAAQRIADLERELQEVLTAIENAPHDMRGFGCQELRGKGSCNCWKQDYFAKRDKEAKQ